MKQVAAVVGAFAAGVLVGICSVIWWAERRLITDSTFRP